MKTWNSLKKRQCKRSLIKKKREEKRKKKKEKGGGGGVKPSFHQRKKPLGSGKKKSLGNKEKKKMIFRPMHGLKRCHGVFGKLGAGEKKRGKKSTWGQKEGSKKESIGRRRRIFLSTFRDENT